MKNQYRVDGDTVTIFHKRRNGDIIESYVSVEDLPRLLEFNISWTICVKANGSMYVVCRKPGTKTSLKLHRFLTGAKDGEIVDHQDRNGLNNRKHNLVVADQTNNMRNTSLRSDNSSGYKGVCYYPKTGQWKAFIGFNKKSRTIGYYNTIEEALEARKEAELKIWGKVMSQ